MSFFARLAQLIKSNLNELISRAEDPEKMLEQVIRDMNVQLLEAKKQVAVAIADEKKLDKQAETEEKEAESWERKAMLAIRASNDELAKEALARKKEHEALGTQLREQHRKQKAAVDQLKLALRALNDKIQEAGRKKHVLVARKRRAEAMKNIQETMSGIADSSAFETFDRMQQRIERLEAESEAQAELAEEASGDVLKRKFRDLEATRGMDADLEALKRKMGVLPPAAEPAVKARVEPLTESVDEPLTEAEQAELESALEELQKREAGG